MILEDCMFHPGVQPDLIRAGARSAGKQRAVTARQMTGYGYTRTTVRELGTAGISMRAANNNCHLNKHRSQQDD